jgi:hypothetical protein
MSGAGEEPDLVDRWRDLLAHREADRLAGVLALHGHELGGTRLDRVGDLEKCALAFRRRRIAP